MIVLKDSSRVRMFTPPSMGGRQGTDNVELPKSDEQRAQEKQSLEERLGDIASCIKCPLGRGKAYLSVIIGGSQRIPSVVLDCQAKRQFVKRSSDRRVHQLHIEQVCCADDYADRCEYYREMFANSPFG